MPRRKYDEREKQHIGEVATTGFNILWWGLAVLVVTRVVLRRVDADYYIDFMMLWLIASFYVMVSMVLRGMSPREPVGVPGRHWLISLAVTVLIILLRLVGFIMDEITSFIGGMMEFVKIFVVVFVVVTFLNWLVGWVLKKWGNRANPPPPQDPV